jgi:hypothetical protein
VGITYFGLSTLFSFEYITPNAIPAMVQEWQATITHFCRSLIENQRQLQAIMMANSYLHRLDLHMLNSLIFFTNRLTDY